MGNVNASSLAERIDEERARAAYAAIAGSRTAPSFSLDELARALKAPHAVIATRLYALLSPTNTPVTFDMFRLGWAAVTAKHSKWHRTVYALLDLDGSGRVTPMSIGAWMTCCSPAATEAEVDAVWASCPHADPAHATLDEVSAWHSGDGKFEFSKVSAAAQAFFTQAAERLAGPERPADPKGSRKHRPSLQEQQPRGAETRHKHSRSEHPHDRDKDAGRDRAATGAPPALPPHPVQAFETFGEDPFGASPPFGTPASELAPSGSTDSLSEQAVQAAKQESFSERSDRSDGKPDTMHAKNSSFSEKSEKSDKADKAPAAEEPAPAVKPDAPHLASKGRANSVTLGKFLFGTQRKADKERKAEEKRAAAAAAEEGKLHKSSRSEASLKKSKTPGGTPTPPRDPGASDTASVSEPAWVPARKSTSKEGPKESPMLKRRGDSLSSQSQQSALRTDSSSEEDHQAISVVIRAEAEKVDEDAARKQRAALSAFAPPPPLRSRSGRPSTSSTSLMHSKSASLLDSGDSAQSLPAAAALRPSVGDAQPADDASVDAGSRVVHSNAASEDWFGSTSFAAGDATATDAVSSVADASPVLNASAAPGNAFEANFDDADVFSSKDAKGDPLFSPDPARAKAPAPAAAVVDTEDLFAGSSNPFAAPPSEPKAPAQPAAAEPKPASTEASGAAAPQPATSLRSPQRTSRSSPRAPCRTTW
eukprot:m51a1_g8338 hypothetical protein (707) ;mRNA; f:179120-181544